MLWRTLLLSRTQSSKSIAVNPKDLRGRLERSNSKGKRGEADNVYDPVSLAHMRLNRKEVHCDYNPSHPDVIIHMFGIPAQTPLKDQLEREKRGSRQCVRPGKFGAYASKPKGSSLRLQPFPPRRHHSHVRHTCTNPVSS